eukprot:symbB.v1.2.019569.t1/scaffold1591.1/size184449/5
MAELGNSRASLQTALSSFGPRQVGACTQCHSRIFPCNIGLCCIIRSLAHFLGRAERSHIAPLKKIHLEPLAKLIPKNLGSLVPGRLVTQGARAKALREMMGPQRVERQKGGLLEAAWLQSLRSWSQTCCPPDVTGALALLHPPPGGLSKWPGLLLSLCLACESRDRRLLQQVQRGLLCSGQGCPMLMRLQIVEQHAWDVWKDPASKRWLPYLQLVLERFNAPKVAKASSGAKEMKVLSMSDTLKFIKAGGSMARFGDGEFWSMDRGFITPVVRNRMLQESLVYVARLGASGCPGFKPALVDVLGPPKSFPDVFHYMWWRERPFFREIPYRYFPPGIYGNMWVNYKPGEATRHYDPDSLRRFIDGWDEAKQRSNAEGGGQNLESFRFAMAFAYDGFRWEGAFASDWRWPAGGVLVYLLVIFALGILMKDLKAFQLQKVAVLHNLLLSIGSLVMFLGTSLELLRRWSSSGHFDWFFCEDATTSDGALYFWSYEMLDTVLVLLQKSRVPHFKLQVYHHAAVVPMAWLWCETQQSLQWGGLLFNTLVHVIMYHYYAMKILNRPTPWKRWITKLQIIQFATSFALLGKTLWHYQRSDCQGMKALVYNCIFNATLIVQFIGVDKRNKAQKKE